MGTLETRLRAARDHHKLLMPYVTGGITEDWLDIIRAYEDAGADAVEIGIPFSDPVMDGPTIQAASEKALARGVTPIEILSELRHLECGIPLIAMTYANVPYRMGYARYVAELGESGVHGAIIPDVPMEELDEWEDAVGDADLDTVLLASPITPTERLRVLAERSRGFVYGVNVLGVTGERAEVGTWTADLAGRLKSVSDMPVVMGFGISTAETAVSAAAPSDGVIIASAIMRKIVDGEPTSAAYDFVADVRRALDTAD